MRDREEELLYSEGGASIITHFDCPKLPTACHTNELINELWQVFTSEIGLENAEQILASGFLHTLRQSSPQATLWTSAPGTIELTRGEASQVLC